MLPVLHATFSIAAYDPGTQSWGVAAQSKYLAVGAVVPWARAGAGAVATQSRVNVGYGPASLELLAQDRAPEAMLEQITAADPGRVWRQIGLVDRYGRTANYTGAKCFPWAGARAGEGYTCQGNMLASADVLAALAETFEQARDRGRRRPRRVARDRARGCPRPLAATVVGSSLRRCSWSGSGAAPKG